MCVYVGDNLTLMDKIPDESIDLIYIDPPFNTGKTQKHTEQTFKRDEDGDRLGYGGVTYSSEDGETRSYNDKFSDYKKMLYPRLQKLYSKLKKNGSMFVHIDFREVHHVRLWMDEIFKNECMSEIIWAYDYGARSKSKWPAKHDNIIWYAKDQKNYIWNQDASDRIPYMSPGLQTPERAAAGKLPTDVWWNTIVPTNSKERTGYPTQKPLAILERIVKVHSNVGDTLLDVFAGSGSFGEAAIKNQRNAILVDENPQALEVIKSRFDKYKNDVNISIS